MLIKKKKTPLWLNVQIPLCPLKCVILLLCYFSHNRQFNPDPPMFWDKILGIKHFSIESKICKHILTIKNVEHLPVRCILLECWTDSSQVIHICSSVMLWRKGLNDQIFLALEWNGWNRFSIRLNRHHNQSVYSL